MKIEVELEDERLHIMVQECVKDFVYDNRHLREEVRQAVRKLVADEAHKVVTGSPEKLHECVMRELTEVLKERDYR